MFFTFKKYFFTSEFALRKRLNITKGLTINENNKLHKGSQGFFIEKKN